MKEPVDENGQDSGVGGVGTQIQGGKKGGWSNAAMMMTMMMMRCLNGGGEEEWRFLHEESLGDEHGSLAGVRGAVDLYEVGSDAEALDELACSFVVWKLRNRLAGLEGG